MIFLVLASWSVAIIGFCLRSYVFKHPKTRLVPKALRHTWFAGLAQIISCIMFFLPTFITGYGYLGLIGLSFVLYASRRKGIKLVIDDLKIHRMEGRGIFQHSEGCYMAEGGTATFMIKRWRKIRGKKEPVDLTELVE